MARRQYRGNAQSTTLAAPVGLSDTTATLTDGSSYPDGTVGPFALTVDSGSAGEEKWLVTSRTGNNLTGITRAYDSTPAASHSAGASVKHTITAVDLDEANAHNADTTRDDHTQYAKRGQGLAANVGAASRAGRLYIATDSEDLYADDGSTVHRYLSKPSSDAAYVPQPATPTALYVIRRNAANTGFEYAAPAGNNPVEIAHPNSLNATALAGTAGILYVRVRPAAAITVTALRVLWSGTAGTGDVGIYSSSGSGSSAVPNTKLVSASATSPGLGWADVTVTSTALAAGTDYWLAVGNGNANVFECNNNSSPEAAALRGQANGALPGTAAPTTSPATWPMIKIMG